MRITLYNLFAAAYSAFKCRGNHSWSPKCAFVVDPEGDSTLNILFTPTKGRYVHYNRCNRCGLRDDGQGYDR